jgi:hypothetical protein
MRITGHATLVVPVADAERVRNILLRHCGCDMLRTPAVAKGAGKGAKPTHYVLDCPADDNLKAVIQNILKDEARVTKVVSAKGVSALATELSKANLETKPKPATSDGGLDREGR